VIKPGAGNCRVLVTRPAGEAAVRLCAAVEAAGNEAYHQPLLTLAALPELSGPQRQRVLDLDRYQHVIFISGNAVQFGMAAVEGCWPQLPVELQWYAIGAATAAQLESHGITAVTPESDMSSEGLLAVSQLQQVRDQRVLIVKGEGGRATLAQELIGRGALVDELACYRREVPAMPPGSLAANLSSWGIDVILLSSGEGLANLQLLLSPTETSNFKHIFLVVPSKRVADQALEAGFDQIITAENASDVAMLCALQKSKPGCGD
jgi:uroporphyrinogen-III synthase